jgi:hypothetical protein
MTRDILVAIHAGSGIAGLAVGLAVFAPPQTKGGSRRWWRIAYGGLLAILLLSLVALVWRDWAGLETGSRLVFTGLAILAGVMLIRMYMAHRLVADDGPGWEGRYVSHVYFTYISLWVGFAIVPALRSGNPGLWIPIAIAVVLSTGTLLVQRYKREVIRPTN